MVMRVATFFPFQATYYLNGHSFIEQELNRAQIGFRKNDNASHGATSVKPQNASVLGLDTWHSVKVQGLGTCSPSRTTRQRRPALT
jgi:hypothetical protein